MARQRKSIMDMARDAMAAGPARKEEEMEHEPTPAIPARRCKCCPCYLMQHEHEVCNTCLRTRRQCVSDRTAERHARFERAYMAALMGLCAGGEFGVAPTVANASGFALETVRQWDAMISQLDGEEGI